MRGREGRRETGSRDKRGKGGRRKRGRKEQNGKTVKLWHKGQE